MLARSFIPFALVLFSGSLFAAEPVESVLPKVDLSDTAYALSLTHAQGTESSEYWNSVARGEKVSVPGLAASEAPQDMAAVARSIADRFPEGSSKHTHWMAVAKRYELQQSPVVEVDEVKSGGAS
ncbi:MAG: hypothetical protein QGG40_14765 [Myxococcota bacterium]|jgi:hypothetical protein|nr:hypothetical protein [Myxococcota bacterium]